MTRPIRLGISPCPNDTFAFHALLGGKVVSQDLDLEIEIADIEELNERFERGELDASKASFAAALHWSDRCVVLRAGSALGFGVGPLLLARPDLPRPLDGRIPADARVLVPGERTTAHLLYRLFHPAQGRIEHVRFSAILPALARGQADYGVCIHEGRFVWRDHGLERVEDLGTTWEERTRTPLPLGGIVARADLDRETLLGLDRAIRDSIDYAHAHRAETLVTMRAHAQELSDEVLWKHVDLYVNAWTRDLGPEGERALADLAEMAEMCGWTRDARRRLSLLEPLPL